MYNSGNKLQARLALMATSCSSPAPPAPAAASLATAIPFIKPAHSGIKGRQGCGAAREVGRGMQQTLSALHDFA